MTREIKVKFWNGKKMSQSYELIDLLYEGVPSILANSNGELDTNPKKLEKIITLEWTGLKDKNGKEIYEGDIVKSSDKEIGVVLWEQESVSYLLSQSDDIDDNHWSDGLLDGEWKIIGDIYENPELLNNLKTNEL